MIVLFTDFGLNGPYVGQMKSAIIQAGYNGPVIDLMHDAPSFNPKASAYLLASLVSSFPVGSVFLCVVDPGVGSERKPLLVKAGGYTFIGPDNGLFSVIVEQLSHVEVYEINWRPESLSSSFHGRDLFCPVAVNAWFEQLNAEDLTESPEIEVWPADLYEIIYIDAFGNCISGIRFQEEMINKTLVINSKKFRYARTFSDVEKGEVFFYKNSNGLCEISMNQESAAKELGLNPGDKIALM